jgi:peptide-methionine (S)-S-oxide reductase
METIQIDYDPTQTSYEQLLDAFWDSHNPTKRSWSRQYMSAIFYHNEEQKRLASQTRDREAAKAGKRIYTEIIPFSEFTLAEAYHQKYRLQQDRRLMQEFSAIYPAAEDFVNSTAAARVNGYLGGDGSLADLEAELSSLGLSAEGGKRLLEIVSPRGK